VLTDPLSVSYNGSSKSLPAITGSNPISVERVLGARRYGTADGEFTVYTRQSSRKDGARQSEITLERRALETDVNTTMQGYFSNSVGLVFTSNRFQVATSVDIPLIRAALLSLVDTTLQGRIINGEH